MRAAIGQQRRDVVRVGDRWLDGGSAWMRREAGADRTRPAYANRNRERERDHRRDFIAPCPR